LGGEFDGNGLYAYRHVESYPYARKAFEVYGGDERVDGQKGVGDESGA